MCKIIMQSLTFVTFMVSEKITMLKLANQKHVNYLPLTHTRVSHNLLCTIFLMSVATTQHLNYKNLNKYLTRRLSKLAGILSPVNHKGLHKG